MANSTHGDNGARNAPAPAPNTYSDFAATHPAWWANYTVTCPTNYQVSWTEFRSAFHAHYIPAGMMRRMRQEFMDLK
jgi:hypothetical protein